MDSSFFWFGPDKDPDYVAPASIRYPGSNPTFQTPLLYNPSISGGALYQMTFSIWGKLGVGKYDGSTYHPQLSLFGCQWYSGGTDRRAQLWINKDGVRYAYYDAGTPNIMYGDVTGEGEFIDESAWYHVVMQIDAQNATASNRVKMWVNNRQLATSGTYPSGASAQQVFGRAGMGVGCISAVGNPSIPRGYNPALGSLSEAYFLSGVLKTPTAFGEYNDLGVWIPKDYTGSYGTASASFKLTFDPDQNSNPAVAIGIDSSGNNNNFTSYGFDFDPASVSYPISTDSPSRNWTTFDSLADEQGRYTFTNTNTDLANTAGTTVPAVGMQSVQNGRWYFEAEIQQVAGSFIGAASAPLTETTNLGQAAGSVAFSYNAQNKSQCYINGATYNYASGSTASVGDIIGVTLDFPSNEVTFYKNGVSMGQFGAGKVNLTGKSWFPAFAANQTVSVFYNFGQRPFSYTPPSGFSPMQSREFSRAQVSTGTNGFRALTGTGANIRNIGRGTSNAGANWNPSINTGFTNGLYWIKSTTAAGQLQILDTNSGNTAITCPASGTAAYSAPSGNAVCYAWDAQNSYNPDGSGGAQGTVAATGRRNTVTGFSMFEYTGTGGAGKLAHGLGEEPGLIILKNRNVTGGTTGSITTKFPLVNVGNINQIGNLNSNAAFAAPSTNIFSQQPDAEFVYLTNSAAGNASGNDYTMYVWAPIEGYSLFGEYYGNGNADGPMVNCGFRPAFVLIKNREAAQNWILWDSTSNPLNPCDTYFYTSNTSIQTAARPVDFFANGFKIMTTDSMMNQNAKQFVFMAFAESPSGGRNVQPATAR